MKAQLAPALLAVILASFCGYMAGALAERSDPRPAETTQFANGMGVCFGLALILAAFVLVAVFIRDREE